MTPDRLYNVLLAPHFSEKATSLSEAANQYVFKVAKDASKPEIREAVETLFKVSVEAVRVLNVKPKIKRTFRGTSRRAGWKKAYVTLAAGQQIDFTSID